MPLSLSKGQCNIYTLLISFNINERISVPILAATWSDLTFGTLWQNVIKKCCMKSVSVIPRQSHQFLDLLLQALAWGPWDLGSIPIEYLSNPRLQRRYKSIGIRTRWKYALAHVCSCLKLYCPYAYRHLDVWECLVCMPAVVLMSKNILFVCPSTCWCLRIPCPYAYRRVDV